MPLESASYINGLEPANPASTDQISQADEHLRLIKSVLKSTFPNVSGPVLATHTELSSPTTIPVGVILAWYGSSASVPTGWAWCNGQTVSLSSGTGSITTPDLRDKVIVGAGSAIAAQGASAGGLSATATTGSSGSHVHTVSGGAHSHATQVLGHSLTEAQIPQHRHFVAAPVTGVDMPGASNTFAQEGTTGGDHSYSSRANSADASILRTSAVGSGSAHSHDVTVDSTAHSHDVSSEGAHTHSVSVSTIQPCMGLHWIMKV